MPLSSWLVLVTLVLTLLLVVCWLPEQDFGQASSRVWDCSNPTHVENKHIYLTV